MGEERVDATKGLGMDLEVNGKKAPLRMKMTLYQGGKNDSYAL